MASGKIVFKPRRYICKLWIEMKSAIVHYIVSGGPGSRSKSPVHCLSHREVTVKSWMNHQDKRWTSVWENIFYKKLKAREEACGETSATTPKVHFSTKHPIIELQILWHAPWKLAKSDVLRKLILVHFGFWLRFGWIQEPRRRVRSISTWHLWLASPL